MDGEGSMIICKRGKEKRPWNLSPKKWLTKLLLIIGLKARIARTEKLVNTHFKMFISRVNLMLRVRVSTWPVQINMLVKVRQQCQVKQFQHFSVNSDTDLGLTFSTSRVWILCLIFPMFNMILHTTMARPLQRNFWTLLTWVSPNDHM